MQLSSYYQYIKEPACFQFLCGFFLACAATVAVFVEVPRVLRHLPKTKRGFASAAPKPVLVAVPPASLLIILFQPTQCIMSREV
jgi:hypothetical protein